MFKDLVVPTININYPQGHSVVHDNCSIHVSKAFHEYAENHTFEIRDWPSRSPDLNIMENTWKNISDIVYSGEQPQKIHMAILEINMTKIIITAALHADFRCRLTKLLFNKRNIIN